MSEPDGDFPRLARHLFPQARSSWRRFGTSRGAPVDPEEVSEPIEGGACDAGGSALTESPSPREPWRFWRALLIASAAFVALSWVLDALPARTGEPLFLRWLRALQAHPLRVPLGWTLAWLGGVRLSRSALRRAERTTRA